MATRITVLPDNPAGVGHARIEDLVGEPEPRQRLVVGDADPGHGRCLAAHEHAVVAHRREPVRLVTNIELCFAETQAEHRAGPVGAAFVCVNTCAEQYVVVRLQIAACGQAPVAAIAQPVTIRQRDVRATGSCALDAGVRQADCVRIAIEEPPDLCAKLLIHLTCLWERVQHGRSGNRASHHGLAAENEHPLDLGLDFGLQVERQVRRYSPSLCGRLDSQQQRHGRGRCCCYDRSQIALPHTMAATSIARHAGAGCSWRGPAPAARRRPGALSRIAARRSWQHVRPRFSTIAHSIGRNTG